VTSVELDLQPDMSFKALRLWIFTRKVAQGNVVFPKSWRDAEFRKNSDKILSEVWPVTFPEEVDLLS